MNGFFDYVFDFALVIGLCWAAYQVITGLSQWHKLKKGQIALALKLKEMGAEM